jgi:uncharacterized membrane-anchored protein YjiN (DUF445 family)
MLAGCYPRYVANGLLFGAFALYGVAHLYSPFGAANPAILATSEAALIGGIADWFAVTALFRRPLNLPIPHTAVIPNSKQRIGEALSAFLAENFVNEKILSTFIGEQVLPKLVCSLETPQARSELAKRLVPFIGEFAQVLKENYEPLVQGVLRPTLAEVRISRVVGGILSSAVKVRSSLVVSRLLFVAHNLLKSHEQSVMKLISTELPWYIPSFVGEKIYRDILKSILTRIESPEGLQDSIKYLERLSIELTVKSELSDTLDRLWSETLNNPQANALQALWHELLAAVSSRGPEIQVHLESVLNIVSIGLSKGAGSQTITGLVQRAAGLVIRHFSRDILRWISDTIGHWDSDTISQKIEEKIGADLQYIRLNGTLVGALVGLTMFFVFG